MISITLFSCEKDEFAFSEFNSFSEPSTVTLSKDIPFTIENMQQAYDNLMENATAASLTNSNGTVAKNGGVTIQASHYYYQFMPTDSLEYDQLNQDTTLAISETPLGLNVSIDMDSLYAALDTATQYPIVYSVFPVGYAFPSNISSVKLGEFYFPPEDSTSNIKSGGSDKLGMDDISKDLQAQHGGRIFELLELEALKLTNNLHQEELDRLQFIDPSDETVTLSYKEVESQGYDIADLTIDYSRYGVEKFWGSKWTPSGRIQFEEDVLAQGPYSFQKVYEGIPGAEVRVRKWGFLIIKRGWTNNQGYFTMGKIRTSNVKYSVRFVNYYFDIKAGHLWISAKYRDPGNRHKQPWNVKFLSGTTRHFHAMIQNAAYDYYYHVVPTYNITRPGIVNICGKYSACISSQARAFKYTNLVGMSDIRISRKQGNCAYRGSDGVYATVIHELTHIGHYAMDGGIWSTGYFIPFDKTADVLRESWAEGVETIVTNDRYASIAPGYFDAGNDNIGWNHWRQKRTVGQMSEYTPVVIDLVDDLNQNVVNGSIYPVDRVDGYNLNQIENALDNCRTITCWENNLKNTYFNSTEQHLTELFDYVRAVRDNL